jgi:hypothetical protein
MLSIGFAAIAAGEVTQAISKKNTMCWNLMARNPQSLNFAIGTARQAPRLRQNAPSISTSSSSRYPCR